MEKTKIVWLIQEPIAGTNGGWKDVETGRELFSTQDAVAYLKASESEGKFRIVSVRKTISAKAETKTVMRIS